MKLRSAICLALTLLAVWSSSKVVQAADGSEVLRIPVVSIRVVDDTASEPAVIKDPAVPVSLDTAQFVVTRVGDTAGDLTVHYNLGGTASNGDDYKKQSGQVVIPAGESSAPIFIVPLDDSIPEDTESVTVTLVTSFSFCLDASQTSPPNPPLPCYSLGADFAAKAALLDNDSPSPGLPPRVSIRVINPRTSEPPSPIIIDDPSNPSVTIPPILVVRPALFEITRTRRNDVPLKIPLAIGGSAINGEDYKKIASEVTIPQGEWSVQVAIEALSDDWVEGVEDVTVEILAKDCPTRFPIPDDCYVIDGSPRAIVYIRDNDMVGGGIPVVTVTAADPDAREGIFPWIKAPTTFWTGAFEIHRSSGTNVDLVVNYTVSGTAENGVDYQKLSGEAIIPAGFWSTLVLVDPIDDTLVEPTESVILSLAPVACAAIFPPSPACYGVGLPSQAKVAIFDFDAENLPPKTDLVKPANGSNLPSGQDIELVAQAADGDGYVPKMEFFDGETKVGEVNIAFIKEPLPGQLQEFRFIWKDAQKGLHQLSVKATDNQGASSTSGTTTVTVDDGTVKLPPMVTIVAKDETAAEQSPLIDVIPNTGLFVVTRTAPLDFDLTVYLTVSGSAQNGADYETIPAKVIIPAGQESVEIRLVALDDTLAEGRENVVVRVEAPICPAIFPPPVWCYNVGKASSAEAWILDDEPRNFPPKISIDSPRSGEVIPMGVDVVVSGQTVDVDGYVSGVALLADGKKVGGITYNFLVEPKPGQIQTYEIIWKNAPAGLHDLRTVATDSQGISNDSGPTTIQISDTTARPTVSIVTTDPIAVEGGEAENSASFRVSRTGSTEKPLTVWLAIHGTAENGVDYETVEGSVTIPAGELSASIMIRPIDDKARERAETVVMDVVEPPFGSPLPSPYQIGWLKRAVAVILDTDQKPGKFASLPNGFVLLHLPTSQGKTYRVEASKDMVHWTATTIATAGEDGVILIEQQDHQVGHTFFRAIPELP